MFGLKNSQISAASAVLLLTALLLHWLGQDEARNAVLILASFIAGVPIAIKAFKALRMKAFSIELLVTIAVIGALIIGEYVESAVVTFLFIFGAWLETRTLEKTRTALKSLIDMTPVEATVIRPEGTVKIPADDLVKGDRVIIRSGEKVAVDGRIASGRALIVEAAITGESVPASKQEGDKVFSGTLLDNGYVEVIAERVGDDTTFSQIIELVENAQETKTQTQKFLDRFAQIYTPSIVILSILVYLISGNVELALTFLVIACPGALVISAPVSMVAGIGNGARHGVLVKGGEIMEKLAKTTLILFDKTGTLTKGRPEVSDIKVWSASENEFLRQVAILETASEHHLGQAIVSRARNLELDLSVKPEQPEVIKGNGLTGLVEGKRLVAGNRKLMASQGIEITDEQEAYAVNREKTGSTAIFAAIDGKVEGIISIADQIKPEAKMALQQLRDQGVQKMIMLTGDNRHAAQLVGNELGLDEVHAEMLPEDKLNWVKKFQAEGYHVAMVGDGINDAPALATADVGLAMGIGGTDISMETADVVLMSDRLDQFAHAHALSKATVLNMKQNTFFAVGTVFILLIGVLLGKIFLASGMLIHEVSVLLVILNAVRLIRYQRSGVAKTKVSGQAASVAQ